MVFQDVRSLFCSFLSLVLGCSGVPKFYFIFPFSFCCLSCSHPHLPFALLLSSLRGEGVQSPQLGGLAPPFDSCPALFDLVLFVHSCRGLLSHYVSLEQQPEHQARRVVALCYNQVLMSGMGVQT